MDLSIAFSFENAKVFLTPKNIVETSKHFSAWAWTENCFVIDFSINEMSKFVLCLDAGVKNEFYETRLMLIAGFNQESQKNPLQRMLFWLEQKTQHNFRSMAKKRKLSFFFVEEQDDTRGRVEKRIICNLKRR